MPVIRPSADLRNNYNEVSTYCNTYNEPVFISKNGRGDLAVMSIELYEQLAGRFELFALLQEGLQSEKEDTLRDATEVLAELKANLTDV